MDFHNREYDPQLGRFMGINYSGLRMEPQQLNTILQQRQNQNTFQNVRCIQELC
jgi:hypothetical protein